MENVYNGYSFQYENILENRQKLDIGGVLRIYLKKLYLNKDKVVSCDQSYAHITPRKNNCIAHN